MLAAASVEEAVVAGKVTLADLTLKIKYEGMKMRLLRRITTLILVLALAIATTVITPGSASANSATNRPASGQYQQTSPGSPDSSSSSSYSPTGHTTSTTTPVTPASGLSPVEPAQPTTSRNDAKASDDEISDDESSDVDPYVIDAYDVKATVDKYNKVHIEETIKATFNKYRHGIIRTINKVNHVARVDGSKSTVYAIISNVKVSSHSSAVREGGDSTSIKLGSSLTYAKRHETYRLSYDYDLGTDPLSSSDEFYFNIIGTGWNTNIGRVTFRITMPEEFSGKPGFSTGSYGERSGSDIVKYNVNGRVITGHTTGRLLAGEALTIRLELPQGYFKLDPVKTTIARLVFVVPVITGIIALALSIMILPFIEMRAEKAFLELPQELLDASMAMGCSPAWTVKKMVLPYCLGELISALLLGGCFAMGATAPILFTGAVAFSAHPKSLLEPAMALPLHLYLLIAQGAGSLRTAYGTAFVMIAVLLLCRLAAAAYARYRERRWRG